MAEKEPKAPPEVFDELRRGEDVQAVPADADVPAGPTPALTRGGKPEADKPEHQDEEDSTIGQRREIAAQVRGGSPARALEPDFAVTVDPRNPDEIEELTEDDDPKKDVAPEENITIESSDDQRAKNFPQAQLLPSKEEQDKPDNKSAKAASESVKPARKDAKK
jgi:hypothetical protein